MENGFQHRKIFYYFYGSVCSVSHVRIDRDIDEWLCLCDIDVSYSALSFFVLFQKYCVRYLSSFDWTKFNFIVSNGRHNSLYCEPVFAVLKEIIKKRLTCGVNWVSHLSQLFIYFKSNIWINMWIWIFALFNFIVVYNTQYVYS